MTWAWTLQLVIALASGAGGAAGSSSSSRTFPDAVAVASCHWAAGKLLVRWTTPEAPADYYELQLAGSADGQAFAVFSSAAPRAELASLLPGTSYWLRVRAHAAGAPSLGPGTWGPAGPATECRTGGADVEGAAADATPPRTPLAASGSRARLLESMRESEFTYDVDYLMNHNSGSILGDAAFLTFSAGNPDQPSFLNVTFANATFTLFCLEVLSVQVPDTFSTGGDGSYADYLSCNDNGNATDPQCDCDNWIDRVIGDLDPYPACQLRNGSACQGRDMKMGLCNCTCSASSLDYSSRYTGMMPVFPQDAMGSLGVWYSHPKATECSEPEQVGARRADGTVCTWKRRPEARVLRGWQVLGLGWNTSSSRVVDPKHGVHPEQVRQNARVFRKAVDSQPLRPWRCEAPEASFAAGEAPGTIVV